MTGKSTEYNDDQSDAIVDALEAAFDMYGDDFPTVLHVRANIEWNNSWNPNPVRTTTIPGLDLGAVKRATDAAVAARNAWRNGKSGPKSWGAQLRDLGRTKNGRDALNGIASPGTRARWAAGKQTPSKANRERIERASRERWDAIAADREARYRQAAREASDALNQALLESGPGADVRFRDIEGFEFWG